MRIQLDEIREEIRTWTFSETAASLGELIRLAADGDYRFVAPVEIVVHAQRVGELIEVEGEVRTELRTHCSRCLNETPITLDSSFELTYQRQGEVTVENAAETELMAEDLGLIEFQGDSIDLDDSVQEQILLALPLQPLCTPACRGLCPHCGADLNQNQCACRDEVFDSRFAALKQLKLKR